MRRQTHGYLPSRRASLPLVRWTTCPMLLRESGMARSRTNDLLCAEKDVKITETPSGNRMRIVVGKEGSCNMCRFYLTSCILCKFVYDACANVNSWTSPVFCARRSSTSDTCRPIMPNWNAKTWHWRQRLSGRKVYWLLLTIIFLLWSLIF